MALSQRGKVTLIPLAAVVMLLFAGAAQAWNCAPGQKNCNGCVDAQTDVNNCGACGTRCIAPPYASAKCYNGRCEYTCLAGWKNCDGKWENGCECAIDSDNNNCGACGVKCKDVGNAVSKCKGKKCEYSCKAGWANCDNDWTNGCECAPDSDVEHCGGCGKKCPEPTYYGGEARCTKGKCEMESCKKGMKYDGGKKRCGKGGDKDGGEGGGKGGDEGGHKGGDEGGHKGGDEGGHKGGDEGGHKGGDEGGHKGGDEGGHKGGDEGGHKGGDEGGHKGGDEGGHKGGDEGGHKGGDEGGHKGGDEGGHKGGDEGGHKGGDEGGHKGGHKGGKGGKGGDY